jgi:hypothetical protein
MHQEFGDIGTMRLVFGLVDNKLNGAVYTAFTIFIYQYDAFITPCAVSHTLPEGARFFRRAT